MSEKWPILISQLSKSTVLKDFIKVAKEKINENVLSQS